MTKLKPMNEEEVKDMQKIYLINPEIPCVKDLLGNDIFSWLSYDNYESIKNQLICEHLFNTDHASLTKNETG